MKVDSHKVDSNKVEKVTKRYKVELSYENKRKFVNLFKEIISLNRLTIFLRQINNLQFLRNCK